MNGESGMTKMVPCGACRTSQAVERTSDFLNETGISLTPGWRKLGSITSGRSGSSVDISLLCGVSWSKCEIKTKEQSKIQPKTMCNDNYNYSRALGDRFLVQIQYVEVGVGVIFTLNSQVNILLKISER